MKSRLLALILVLSVLFALFGCTSAPANDTEASTTTAPAQTEEPTQQPQTPETDTPIFWRVAGNGYQGEFYLVGSIHVSDGIVYPQSMLDAYARCDALAVESDVIALEEDYTALVEIMKRMLYTDGSKISDHIDAQLYEDARALMESLNIWNDAFDYYIPIFWAQLIESALLLDTRYSSDSGVDRHFLEQAKEDGKEVLEIEEYLDVYEGLSGLSEQTQLYMLRQTIEEEYGAEYESSVQELLEAWKCGDLNALMSLLYGEEDDTELSEQARQSVLEYNRMLVTERNRKMADAAISYLQQGKNVFYVVGLAHMLGGDGIITLLTAQGYTVTPVES